MIKFVDLKPDEPEMQSKKFVLTIQKDGEEMTSNVLIVKDGNDWVFQEEGNQRFGPSELRAIAKELDKLNGRYVNAFGNNKKRKR